MYEDYDPGEVKKLCFTCPYGDCIHSGTTADCKHVRREMRRLGIKRPKNGIRQPKEGELNFLLKQRMYLNNVSPGMIAEVIGRGRTYLNYRLKYVTMDEDETEELSMAILEVINKRKTPAERQTLTS